jgi:murein DD-endopeptidase MepM/ murein hydrolase activator NlpD
VFLLVGALGAVTIPAPVLGHPQTQAEIEQRIAELKRLRERLDARERSVREGIPAVAERRDALTRELEELQAITEGVQARVNAAAAVLAGIQARLDEKNAELRKAEHAIEARLLSLRERAVHVYKHGPASLLDMVVGAEGFGEFLRRFAYMAQVIRTDNEKVAEIRRMRANIMRQRDVIAHLRDRAAQQMAVVVHERDHAVAIARSVATERNAVVGELQGKYSQLGDIRQQKEQYERETAQLQAESLRIASFLKGQAGGAATVSPRGMIWPVAGPVTSGFGWRTHPIFETRRFHAGIDIGAPSGSPIAAAATGRVIYAGTQAGYGRHVIIGHGGGIATLYAHLSSIAVPNGTMLARGGRLGAVGCTGYCTGPHLHFEVRVNGEPDNPMRWLP